MVVHVFSFYVFARLLHRDRLSTLGRARRYLPVDFPDGRRRRFWEVWKQFKGHRSPRAKYAGWIDCAVMTMVQAGMSAQRV
jgi:hypothetical protein